MKAAIHAMHKMYKAEHNEAVLLVDTANAFNFVNRKVFLHNINVNSSLNKHLCTELLYITIQFIYHWKDWDKNFWKNNARWSCWNANLRFISYTTHANGIRDSQD